MRELSDCRSRSVEPSTQHRLTAVAETPRLIERVAVPMRVSAVRSPEGPRPRYDAHSSIGKSMDLFRLRGAGARTNADAAE